MKMSIVLPGLVFMTALGCAGGGESPVLNGPYLGQEIPGHIPVLFAPDIVSTPEHEHSRLEFSRDGREIFWAVLKVPFEDDTQHIWHVRQEGARWSYPARLPFAMENRAGSPALSPDGQRLYYMTRDPASDKNTRPRRQLLWEVRRRGSGWGAPRVIRDLIPQVEGKATMSICFADNGNLYYDLGGPRDDGRWEWDILMREYRNGQYGEPKLLGNGINDGIMNWTPYVSPDETYLIFSSARMNDGDFGDLLISYRRKDGDWTMPVGVGSGINTSRQERFPGVSPDGRYFFFARNMPEHHSEMFWVDAGFIEHLVPEVGGVVLKMRQDSTPSAEPPLD